MQSTSWSVIGALLVFMPVGPRLPTQCGNGNPGTVECVSTTAQGLPSMGSYVSQLGMSRSGRFVAFQTDGALVPEDVNQADDCYLKDVETGLVHLCSKSTSGVTSGFGADYPRLSGDGRLVTFSTVWPLESNDQNSRQDVYVRDWQAAVTELISVNPSGVAGNGFSFSGDVSGDGRWVIFGSSSTDLVVGDTNGKDDLFLRYRRLNTTEIVSLSSSGEQGNGVSSQRATISDDGRFIAFSSWATNFAEGDNNATIDLFLRDRALGTTVLIDHAWQGGTPVLGAYDPRISADGAWVAFMSESPNLVSYPVPGFGFIKVFYASTRTGEIQWASHAIGGGWPVGACGLGYLSDDGRYLSMWCSGQDFTTIPVPAQGAHAYVYDRLRHEHCLLSRTPAGAAANDFSVAHGISGDGRYVVVFSKATDFAPGPPPGPFGQAYRLDRGQSSGAFMYCTPQTIGPGCEVLLDASGSPSVSQGFGFHLSADLLPNAQRANLVYSLSGSTNLPFGSGRLCIAAPPARVGFVSTGGQATGSDCSGSFDFDFNSRIASGVDPALIAGQQVWAQLWVRAPGQIGLARHAFSDAAAFAIGP